MIDELNDAFRAKIERDKEFISDMKNMLDVYWYILRHAETGNPQLLDAEYKGYENYYRTIVKKYPELQ